jgi:tetraacyldisaccharide 4'-kinase
VLYRLSLLKSWRFPVPVIVVGNINVGGTGKTPLVIALVEQLRRQGYHPGVVSRGYGSQAPHYPYTVTEQSQTSESGDEPRLIVKRTGVPLVIGSDRVAACQQLLSQFKCDVIVSDDGLQHYRLARDIECVVVDGERGFGNGHCLPVGPLREPVSRLRSVDFIISNGDSSSLQVGGLTPTIMQLSQSGFRQLSSDDIISRQQWHSGMTIHAVAGIGNPDRFFTALRAQGFEVIEHRFPDHHQFVANDLEFGDALPVVMTEKDAIKLPAAVPDHWWSVPVTADIDNAFYSQLIKQLERV